MRRAPRLGLTAASALAFTALGCRLEPLATPETVEPALAQGGFEVDLVGERLVVASSDGRVLLDGLAPAAADPATGAPAGGVALLERTTTWEMQFGAFKPTEVQGGPTLTASDLRVASPGVLEATSEAGVLARFVLSTPEEGHLAIELEPGDAPGRDLSLGFRCEEGEAFGGFGAQTAQFDHRGERFFTWVQEQGIGKDATDDYEGVWPLVGRKHSSHIPIPQYLSNRGFVFTTQTDRRTIFDLCKTSPDAFRVEVTLPATLHVFDGPSPAAALERASATFGRPRMPPKVAFAPWGDAIYGSDNVRRVAQKLRDEQIPISVLWTEDWKGAFQDGDNYTLEEEWEVDPDVYPDLPTLADDLHALGFHFHVYFNPFVYEGTKAWSETAPNGWLVERADGTPYTFTGAKFDPTSVLDVDHPDARAWAVDKMRAAIALGADGWMHDFAEWLPADAVTYAGVGDDRHNPYPVRWQELAREAIDGAPDAATAGRTFFVRSGWFGTPAIADVVWAGDQRTSFDADDGLPTIVPIGIGLGVVGISTYGHDIAGYQSSTNAGSTEELWYRWAALGAWSPVMRTHHGAQPGGNWDWEKDAGTIAHWKRMCELHMALVPYMEGLALRASQTGLPIWRGLALDAPSDPVAWTIIDEVFVGDHVLVAPVSAPGQTSRDVYLPSGVYYPWEGGAAVVGPATVAAAAPITEIPVFARAGAVVPTYPPGVMTLVNGSPEVPDHTSVGDDRVVHVFLGGSGAFTEAGGLTYELSQGAQASEGALPEAVSSLTWEGALLPACGDEADHDCVAFDGARTEARVTGPGTLTFVGASGELATLVVGGGAADRRLFVRARHG